jgi:UDP-N-acetylglucosamine 2-epimerase (non-hydrolysing)
MENKIKVATVVGTRPELIRLSRIIPLLDKYTDHKLIHTGQNHDYELNEIFFKELEIRKPDYYLDADKVSLGKTIADIIVKIEDVFKSEKPDAVIILGDTNSSLSAIIAKRMKIPIYHMEAGNRSFDLNVPEEINRKIVDHISDFNLVYTEHSRRHLLSEGFPHRRIYLTGSPLKEVLDYYLPKIKKSQILNKLSLEKGKYFLLSTHREENVDNPDNLRRILSIMNKIAEKYSLPIIVSTHPRTRNRIDEFHEIKLNDRIRFLKPFGYFDYVFLQMNAKCTISDSGTISEESAILGFPAVTIRNSMERPEALDTGVVILTGLNSDIVISSIDMTDELNQNDNKIKNIPIDYQISNTSSIVVKLILGTAKLSNLWSGVT